MENSGVNGNQNNNQEGGEPETDEDPQFYDN